MKKTIAAIFLVYCCMLSSCGNTANPVNYYLNDAGDLIVEYDNGKTENLGDYEEELIKSIGDVVISEDGYYIINGVKTEIAAKTVTGYEISENGDLIIIYSDGTRENNGKLDDSFVNGVDTITVSEDGYYVINGIKTDIVAKQSYTVTFDSGFETDIKNQVVLEGKKVERPEVDRTGYTLVGWFCNGEEWRFNSDIVLNDMELKAEWDANEYTVSFDTNGEFDIDDMILEYDSSFELPNLSKTGYEFLGWSYDGKIINSKKWNIDSDVTLTSEWEANHYVITLDPNGGDVSQETINVKYGEAYKLPVPTNEFGTFKGWYYGDIKLTDEFGNSLEKWGYAENITVTTSWVTEIYTIDDLLNIKNALNGYYVLMNDLDISNVEWVPIGKPAIFNELNSSCFTGVLDGNNHSITGLTINSYLETISSYGLFAYNYGVIKNLKLSNVSIDIKNIDADTSAGAIAGYNYGVIDNCYVSGLVSISNHSGSIESSAGGIVGTNASINSSDFVSKAQVTNTINDANVIANNNSGGIVGFSLSSLPYVRCTNNGDVTSSQYSGGIVAYSYGDVFSECRNTGNIKGSQDAGGILGIAIYFVSGAVTSFDECVNTGYIESAFNTYECEAGGIAGEVYSPVIINCYNTGNIKGYFASGIIGKGTIDPRIENCYNNGNINGYYNAAGIFAYGSQAKISNCVNFGNITSNVNKGHIYIINSGGTQSNCYYVKQSGSFSDENGVGVSQTNMTVTEYDLYSETLFWDISSLYDDDSIWYFDMYSGPTLRWELSIEN